MILFFTTVTTFTVITAYTTTQTPLLLCIIVSVVATLLLLLLNITTTHAIPTPLFYYCDNHTIKTHTNTISMTSFIATATLSWLLLQCMGCMHTTTITILHIPTHAITISPVTVLIITIYYHHYSYTHIYQLIIICDYEMVLYL